jgi:hypothetical protein
VPGWACGRHPAGPACGPVSAVGPSGWGRRRCPGWVCEVPRVGSAKCPGWACGRVPRTACGHPGGGLRGPRVGLPGPPGWACRDPRGWACRDLPGFPVRTLRVGAAGPSAGACQDPRWACRATPGGPAGAPWVGLRPAPWVGLRPYSGPLGRGAWRPAPAPRVCRPRSLPFPGCGIDGRGTSPPRGPAPAPGCPELALPATGRARPAADWL